MNLKCGFLFLLFEINLILVKNFEVENNNNNLNNKTKENNLFEIILYIFFIISKIIINFFNNSFNIFFMFNFNNLFESF